MRAVSCVVLSLGVTSCGRYEFGERVDAQNVIVAAMPCAWNPVPTFVRVEPIASINTAGYDADPTLSRDLLTLFYRDDAGVHMTRRASPNDAFGPREEIPTAVSLAADNGFFLGSNNLDAFVCVMSAPDNYDINAITRPTETAPFGPPVLVSELAAPFHEFNARLSPDEQTLLFLRWSGPTPSTARLHLAHRQGTTWTNIEQVFPTSTAVEEAGSFVGDSLHIVYASDGDLYAASRPSEADPFGAPTLITGPGIGISTADSEEIPFVSADGCELLFLSSRSGGVGFNDIYHAVAVP